MKREADDGDRSVAEGQRQEEDDRQRHGGTAQPVILSQADVKCHDLRHSHSITAIKAASQQIPGAALASHAKSIMSDWERKR